MNTAKLGLNLKKLRRQQGLTLVALAEKTKMSHSFIGSIEKGRKMPSEEKIKALAMALGVDPSEIADPKDIFFPDVLQEFVKSVNLLEEIFENLPKKKEALSLVDKYNLANNIDIVEKLNRKLDETRLNLLGDKSDIFYALVELDSVGKDFVLKQMEIYRDVKLKILNEDKAIEKPLKAEETRFREMNKDEESKMAFLDGDHS